MTALPPKGPSIGSGGFGDVFIDPEDETLCIKVFRTPLRGDDARRLLDLVDLVARLRPSERAFLTSRFAWPLEAFGTERKIVGYRMPRVPESGVFDLLVAGRMAQQVLQAKYLLDPEYWDRAAVQSAQPELSKDGRILVVIELLRAFRLLHRYGHAYEDLSSNNVCVLDEPVPRVFLLDADSVIPLDGKDRGVVRSVDWEVDEQLGPAQRDRVKAAMFAWRMLLEDRRAVPARADVADFDDRTGTILGASIVQLAIQPEEESVDQLLEDLYEHLSPQAEHALITATLATGYARELLPLAELSTMTQEIRDAVDAQIALEERVEYSTGLQRRLMVRGLRERGEAAFHLDIQPGTVASTPPQRQEELERLILTANYDALLDHFLDGELGAFAGHPWRDRAIQHALIMEPGPDLETFDVQGVPSARFRWPDGELVDAALLRISTGGALVDERVIVRQAGNSSVRIRGIGAGFPEGQLVEISVTFCVRGDDGTVVECPAETVATVTAPAPQRPPTVVTRAPRAVRVAEREATLPGEAALDVARPDPNAPAERRRRRRRRFRVLAASTFVIGVATVLLSGRAVDDVRIDAAAVRGDDAVEVVWAARGEPERPVVVRDVRIERRVLGPLWFGRERTLGVAAMADGGIVRVSTPDARAVRVRVRLADGTTVRSGALRPVEASSMTRSAPAEPDVAWEQLPDGRGLISWQLPATAEGSIVERVQVVVLDAAGERVLRTSTGRLGLILPVATLVAGADGLDVRVGVVTSAGVRSGWAELSTGPLDVDIDLRPQDLEVIGAGSADAQLRWGTAPGVGAIDGIRFEILATDPVREGSWTLDVDGTAVPLADVFEDGATIVVARVRAVLADGTAGPTSTPIILRAGQLAPQP